MARPKGAKNKVSATAKENVAAVFTRLRGTAGMADWARLNLTEFYKLYGRLIPVDNIHSGQAKLEVEVSYPTHPTKPPETP
jgi:hypothetical protein